MPQSIRVNRYSTYSGDISLDEIKKSNPSSPASTANNLDPTSSIVTAPDFPSPPPEKDPTKEYVIALYKFESDVDGDLSFKVKLFAFLFLLYVER